MATLTGKTPKNTYKDLLQVSNSNRGVDATLRPVEDGEGTQSALQLSATAVNVAGDFLLDGEDKTEALEALSGTNTGDQTITLTGDATGTGTGSFAVAVTKINGETPATVATSGNFRHLSNRPVLGFGRRLATIGDSLSAYNVYNNVSPPETSFTPNGPISALQNRWGHRFDFDPALNKGIGGNTTAQMRARYLTDIAANYGSFDWLSLLGGTNDAAAFRAPDLIFSDLLWIALQAVDNGKQVAWFTPWPRGGWNALTGPEVTMARKILLAVRYKILDYCAASNDPIFCIDAWPDLVDPTSASSDPVTSPIRLLTDNLHGSIGGMFSRVARRAEEVLSPYVPPRPRRMAGGGDLYDATYNPHGTLLSNPSFLTTTGGSKDSDIGGNVPASWQGKDRGGSFTSSEVVASTVSGTQGYDSGCSNAFKIAVNIAGGKSANEIVGFKQDVNVAGKWVAGDRIIAGLQASLTNVSNLKWISCAVADYDGTTQWQYKDGVSQITSNNYVYPEDQDWYFEPPVVVIKPNPVSLALEFQACFDASGSGASADIELLSPVLRHIFTPN